MYKVLLYLTLIYSVAILILLGSRNIIAGNFSRPTSKPDYIEENIPDSTDSVAWKGQRYNNHAFLTKFYQDSDKDGVSDDCDREPYDSKEY